MRISTLGPQGTFSQEVAQKLYPKEVPLFKKTVWGVFESVSSGETDVGIVPLENSLSGSVGFTMDALFAFKLQIVAEELLEVRHCLASFVEMKEIRKLYAHPHTYEQCERFVREHLPEADVVSTASNADSARMLKEGIGKNGALVPKVACKLYGLPILKEDVQDAKSVTRFIVISKKKAEQTGNDRTSIAVMPRGDRPGLLLDILKGFADNKVNLSKLESRPSKEKLGVYVFFIDLQGHEDDVGVQKALEQVRKVADVVVFGSFGRRY